MIRDPDSGLFLPESYVGFSPIGRRPGGAPVRSSGGGFASRATVAGSGGSIVLSGSGFGTKSTAAPLYFDTFESYSVDATVADVGLESPAGASNCKVRTERPHSGSKCLRMVFPEASTSNFPKVYKSVTGNVLDAYMGCWVYWERPTGTGGGTSPIYKWGRMGSSTLYSGQPQFRHTLRPSSSGSGTITAQDNGYEDGVNLNIDNTLNQAPTRDNWWWVEYKYRLSTAGVADGFYKWLCQGTLNGNQDPAETRASGFGSSYIDWMMTVFDGMDSFDGATEYHMHVDELLMDTTFARVIATDAETYGSSTKWAPQPVSAWSDTEITIESPNWSDLTPGSTAYFHVFDQDDAHVTSFARTVP